MAADALLALVFAPLLAATAAAVVPARWGRALALVCALSLPALLVPLTLHVAAHGVLTYRLAGLDTPLGIHLRADGLSVLLLSLVAVVMVAATAHAARSIGAGEGARRFWAAWLMLLCGLNTLLVSGDLFNLYVGVELLTLAAVALVAWAGKAEALRAAMRYLLLAMLGSLVYLLGVALVYATSGTLDLLLVRERLPEGSLTAAALVLMVGGLLVKTAIFPVHGWLPPAHASAAGPVSAVLSALVVKASLYVVFRLWFEAWPELPPAAAGTILASMGAGGVLFGSVMALRQARLKRVIAYSTVAQLGYLMLVFGMPSEVAWQGAVYQLLSHGLAKAAMFLAAANLLTRLGSDALERLPGADQRLPVSVFAFGLAGVSLMGLPPSGGFLAKWMLLSAAWDRGAWIWVIVILAGSLLAAAYLFRVLSLMYTQPAYELADGEGEAPGLAPELAALALALLAIAAGFFSAPVLELLSTPASLQIDLLPAALDGGAP
jgi:multicomponent Na+:H+ antiporter subunit D